MKTVICVVPHLTLTRDTGGTGISYTKQFHSLHYLRVRKKKKKNHSIFKIHCALAEYTSYQQHSSRVFGDAENVFQMEDVKRPAEFFKFHFKFVFLERGFCD